MTFNHVCEGTPLLLLFCNSKRPVFVVVVVVVAILWISSTQIYEVNKLLVFTLLIPSVESFWFGHSS